MKKVLVEKSIIGKRDAKKGEAPMVILPKDAFGIEIEEGDRFIAVRKQKSNKIELHLLKKKQRAFSVSVKTQEDKLDKFIQDFNVLSLNKAGLKMLPFYDGVCKTNCMFEGVMVVEGFVEAIIEDVKKIIQGWGIAVEVNIEEVK